MKMTEIMVVGGGLAGCEAAYALAERGHRVRLVDIKPARFTPAHSDERLGSLIISAADATSVPAGGALAVDRALFAQYITKAVSSHKNIAVTCGEVTKLPHDECFNIATGPLTCESLSAYISA